MDYQHLALHVLYVHLQSTQAVVFFSRFYLRGNGGIERLRQLFWVELCSTKI